ncbi:MAG: LysE family transporter [Saprospiraceae bacterium]|nr:LysE family transporter [Saprospiraceae bacterium]MCB9326021.1 LysE family transporter [Lewinellaceae bacterium]
MNLIWQGILLGLGLSVLVGPLIFLYIQVGIQFGFRSAFFLGLGAWMSDLMFILIIYFGISFVLQVTGSHGFVLWMGIIGGVILIFIGAGLLLHRPKEQVKEDQSLTPNSSLLGFWLKGFLINTFNPFAVFFWISIMTGFSANKYSGPDISILFASILGTIIATDILKILLARPLKRIMSGDALLFLQKIVGTALVLLGLILVYRVF